MTEHNRSADIIISFAQEDLEPVNAIAEALRKQGWLVWCDFPTLSPSLLSGHEVHEARFEFDNAKWIVFVWSRSSVELLRPFSNINSNLGYKSFSDIEHKWMVSVTLDEELRVPEPFNRLRQHNLSQWNGDISAPNFQKFLFDFAVVSGALEETPVETRHHDGVGSQGSLDQPDELPDSLKQAIRERTGTSRSNRKLPMGRKNSSLAGTSHDVKSPGPMSSSPIGDKTVFYRRRVEPPEIPDSYSYAPESGPSLSLRLFRYALIAGGLAIAGWLGYKFLPLLFGVTFTAKNRGDDDPSGDAQPVDCSVFAPPKMVVGGEILLQIYLHPPELKDDAEAGAKQFDSDAAWRGFASLTLSLAEGTLVAVQLDIDGVAVGDGGVGQIRWNNRVTGTSFWVSAPEGTKSGKYRGTARLMVNGVPAGKINFIVEVVASVEAEVPAEPLGDLSHRYKKAFISYASPDRGEVLKRVQTLGALKIDYFQDVLDLDPGDRWEQELYKEIDKCDLFLLFWSSASKGSKWVRKEATYALQRQSDSEDDEPDIIPMLIEGPPPPKPWPEFNSRHFNDKLLYVMRYSEDS